MIAGMHVNGVCVRMHDGPIAKEPWSSSSRRWRPCAPLSSVGHMKAHRTLGRAYVASTEGRIKLTSFRPMQPTESGGVY